MALKREPTVLELMVASPRTSGSPNEGLEKAAAQAQVGEIFEAMTKEAKEEIIGTLGWGGRVFGEEISKALEPTLAKMASLLAEIKEASKGSIQRNMEFPDKYHGGSPAGKNPGGLPADVKNIHTHSNEANVAATATPTNNKKTPGGKGWSETEPTRKALAKAKTIHEQGKTGADVSELLARMRGGSSDDQDGGDDAPDHQEPDGDERCDDKRASLADFGRQFRESLQADLAKLENR